MVQQNNYVAIIAGGIGSRFWPYSRNKNPKQFLDINNSGKSLLQSTYERFEHVVPMENIFIVTSEEYKTLVKEQLPMMDPKQMLLEPERKNTAACIAYATYKILSVNPEANILIAPSDHLITGEEKFNKIIQHSFDFASKHDALVTIGIKPYKPSTGYGYIQYFEEETKLFKKVKTFTEKPSIELAKTFVQSGDFLWNAGIFVFNAKSFVKSLSLHLDEMYELFESIKNDLNTSSEAQSLETIYSQCPSISIDYGIMEKSDNVYVIPADFEWSDLGSWSSLYDLMPKDYLGNVVLTNMAKIYNASNNLIVAPKNKMVIIDGIDNVCVIETDDVLMILPIQKEQEVKNITTDLKLDKLDKFL
jgi:mannose-1-phosphate guanylyltransferase